MVGLLWIGLCLLLGMACSSKPESATHTASNEKVAPYDSLLAIANDYANWVYECNVNGDHATALVLADSVLYECPLSSLFGKERSVASAGE